MASTVIVDHYNVECHKGIATEQSNSQSWSMVHMIEEGFRNSICFGCLSLKWHQAASKSFFVNESSIEGTIATSGDKTKQLRKLVNGSVGRYSCLLQYLFWLLASKMTSGSLRPRSPYLAYVRPLCNSEASVLVGLRWISFLKDGTNRLLFCDVKVVISILCLCYQVKLVTDDCWVSPIWNTMSSVHLCIIETVENRNFVK